MSDNWQHRSQNMSCKTCMWFVVKEKPSGVSSEIGHCRKHAPTMGGYPVVFKDDWCGSHKLDENKI